MDHAKLAKQYFLDGYNCAQAVLCAFSDVTGLDIDASAKIASSFGGGMGRMREVCGACSGMFMAAGMIMGYSDPKSKLEKTEHYKRIQLLAGEFKENNGSIICRELLSFAADTSPVPEDRTENYYKRRPCADYVEDAAAILEGVLIDLGVIEA